MPKQDDLGNREYIIFASDGYLHVRGVMAGDKITVYGVAGQLVLSGTALSDEFIALLPFIHTGYVVKVNEAAQTVLNL